MTVAEQYNQI